MATAKASNLSPEDLDKLRDDWLARLTKLIDQVEAWGIELGWSTRRIERKKEDHEVGNYKAPALLMQEGVTRIILEPIGRSAPGADGVVDLYALPAYDDIATLFYRSESDRWLLLDKLPFDPLGPVTEAMKSKPLSFEMIRAILTRLIEHDS